MLIILHNGLHGLQRDVNDVLDIVEAFVRCRLASGLLQVESQVIDGPLRTVLSVVIVTLLLNGYVRQMNLHIVKVVRGHIVLLVAETSEALRREPDLQRPIARNEHVYAQVKLLPAN